jgi:hypothetical protein
MPGKRSFEDQIAALDALRQQPEQTRLERLRKALTHRNNFLVGKAADLVREFRVAQLLPELRNAFDRFFDNPVKTDPQCWAKNALSRALAAGDYQEAEVFLRGMRHIRWNRSGEAPPTRRELCAPPVRWRSCNAAV